MRGVKAQSTVLEFISASIFGGMILNYNKKMCVQFSFDLIAQIRFQFHLSQQEERKLQW